MKINNKKIILIVVVLLFLRIIYKSYVFNYKYTNWNNEKIVVDIYNIEKIQDEKIIYKVKYDKNYFLLSIKNQDIKYKIGDRLEILSSKYDIEKYNNPYEFDYKKYLNSKNIVSVIYCNKVLQCEKGKNNILSFIGYIRDSISKRLDIFIGIEYSNLIKSLMYGDDLYLDSKLKEEFRDVGLGHMLCISGSHVLCLLTSFEHIFKSKRKRYINIIILIYFYFLSLFKISLFRPIFMYIISIIFKKITYRQKYIITLIILLFINPYYILNIGIIFSFLTVLSIKLFYNLINSWLVIHIKNDKKIVKYIIDNVSLTISAQVLIIPFELYYFQKISLISIVSNILVGYLLNIALYFIFFLYILIFIPFISNFMAYMCRILLIIIIRIVEILSSINYLNIQLPKPNVYIMCIMYIILLIYLYKKLIILYFWNKRKAINKIVVAINYIFIVIIITWNIYTIYFEKYAIFFNVGQGNMALLHYNTKNIIVDIGSTKDSISGNIMLNFLKGKGIRKIDLVLLTHMHKDHINGLEDIIDKGIRVERVGFSNPIESTEEYNNLKKILKENHVCIIQLSEKDEIILDNNYINILSPPKNNKIKDSDLLNANSTIFLVSNYNKNYLFMGDSTSKTEKYILDKYINNSNNVEIFNKLKNIYVYQVSHHGSNTSSYENFLSNISIKNAVISSKKSVYGHPNKEVLDRFFKLNIRTIITEKNGAIRF